MRVVLASQSPRRLDLLRQIGVEPEVRPADVDERLLAGEAPAAAALRLARAKAAATPRQGAALIVAADTLVVVGGAVLGKPGDDAEARRMLGSLAGRGHQVLTGLALRLDPAGPTVAEVAVTEVEFLAIGTDEIDRYVATGEGRDKAGAYAIQGQASRFVRAIRGSYTNVVGLPTGLLRRLAGELGVDLPAASDP